MFCTDIVFVVFDQTHDQNCPTVVSVSDDKQIIIWDILSGHKIRSIIGCHSNAISAVIVYVPPHEKNNDFVMVSCSKDKSNNVVLWNFSSTRSAQVIRECDAVTALVVYDPKDNINNPISIVVDISGEINIWDIATVKLLGCLDGHKNRINGVAVTPVVMNDDSKRDPNSYQLYIATCDGSCIVYLRQVRVCLGEVEEINFMSFQLKYFFLSIGFLSIPSSDGGSVLYLVKGGGPDHRNTPTQLWKLEYLLSYFGSKETIKEKDMLEPKVLLKDHTHSVRCIVPYSISNSTDKHVYMLTGSYDKTAILWSFTTDEFSNILAKKLHTLKKHEDPVFTITVYDPPPIVKKFLPHPLIVTGSFDNKGIH